MKIKLTSALIASILCASPLYAKNLPDKFDQLELDTKLRTQYSANQLIDLDRIQLQTDSPQVKVSGSVDSKLAYDEAIEIARHTKGVVDVDVSDLVIKGHAHYMKDLTRGTQLSGKCLKRKLDRTDPFSYDDLNIEVKDDRAFIKASVPCERDKQALINIVQSHDNIQAIKADIQVTNRT